MKSIFLIIALGILISGCSNMISNPSDSIPEIMQPDWKGIENENLAIKFGQILKFSNDSIDLSAIVLDFFKDESGQWFGLCFIHNNQLFGRQIPNGVVNTTCLDLFDLSYIQGDSLMNYKVVDSIIVNKVKIGIGSQTFVTNMDDITQKFIWGKEQRKKEQTPCDKGLTDLNPVRECYFDFEKIKS